jgi:ubiquinone/menaquinone biosynthesis C-methylase UbiE
MSGTDTTEDAWKTLAPAWIKEVREGPSPIRNGLLDLAVMHACGNLAGLDVMDSGCGEGRFCRKIVDAGASSVVGVDFCEAMIAAARERQGERDAYYVGDVENLGAFDDQQFDLVVSYLNQCDLRDFSRNNREISRVLRPNGRFVVANLHPMRSAVGGWHKGVDGRKEHVILDRYFDEGERKWKVMDVEITNFHRTLSTYIRGFRDSGFQIEDIVEPSADPDAVGRYPELEDELRVPNFIIFVLRKCC